MASTTTREFDAEEIDWEDIGHITGPYGAVNTVCFSPNGEFLAIGGEAGVVVILSTNDWQCRNVFSISVPVRVLCWEPNTSGIVFVGYGNGDIVKLQLPGDLGTSSQKLIYNFSGLIVSVAISNSGSKFAVAFDGRVALCCNFADDGSDPVFHEIPMSGQGFLIRDIHFLDEKRLAVTLLNHKHNVAHTHSTEAPFTRMWSIQRRSGPRNMVLGSAVSPSGMNLAILSSEGVDLYSIISRNFLKTTLLRLMERAVTIQFMSEGTIIAGGDDGYITIATVGGDGNPRIITFPGAGPLFQAVAYTRLDGGFTIAIGTRDLEDRPESNGVILIKEKLSGVFSIPGGGAAHSPPMTPVPTHFGFNPASAFTPSPTPRHRSQAAPNIPLPALVQAPVAPPPPVANQTTPQAAPLPALVQATVAPPPPIAVQATPQAAVAPPPPVTDQATPQAAPLPAIVQATVAPPPLIADQAAPQAAVAPPPPITDQATPQAAPLPAIVQATVAPPPPVTDQATPQAAPLPALVQAIVALPPPIADQVTPQAAPLLGPVQPTVAPPPLLAGPVVPAHDVIQPMPDIARTVSEGNGNRSRRDIVINRAAIAVLVLWFAWGIHQVSPSLLEVQASLLEVQAWARQVSERLPTVAFPNVAPLPPLPPSPSSLDIITFTLTQTETTIQVQTRTIDTIVQSKATAGTVPPIPTQEPLTQTLTKTVTVEHFLTKTSTRTIQATMPKITTCQPALLERPVNSYLGDIINYAYHLLRFAMLIFGLLAAYAYLMWIVWLWTFHWAESGKDIDVEDAVETRSIGVGADVVETRSIGIGADVVVETRSIRVGEGGKEDPGSSRVEEDDGTLEADGDEGDGYVVDVEAL